jgi:hypothetical protein
MSQVLNLKHKGLYTSPNEFSSVPEGALIKANNIVIDVDGIAEPRRGFDRVYTLSDASYRITRYAVYQNTLMASFNSGASIGYLNSTTFTAVSGTYSHPSSTLARTRFLAASNNLYFNTASGVYRMDSYSATPSLAGVPKGLDIQVSATGASGFLATANQCAYRVVWGIRDAQNNLIIGAPSGRAVLINTTGGSRDASLVISIPSGITTSHFFQVYRSKASGGAAISPDDELGLVYENNPTSGEISAGTLTFTDATTDDLRGATIYTAPSQEGIALSNERPPQADYIEEFQGSVIYGNCKSKHRKIFTILSTGGSSGLAVDDVITIAGVAYTAKAAETIASGQFKVFTGGTAAQDIADTAASLIRVINRYTSNTLVNAYYLSGENDLPGQILIEERGIGGSSFTIAASLHGTAYNPNIATAVTSENDDFQNQIMFSKPGKSEAVPLAYSRRVGSANNAIIGLAKLRNTLFIFKDKEGIYRMTGNDPASFTVELFDSSAKLLSPDSIAVVNNQVWCLCDQGITIVTETGVSVVSRPIEDLILDTFGAALNAVKYYSFGVGYESDRKYILFTVSESTDTVAQQAFVFNVFTKAYTRWNFSKSAAIVNPVDDKLYLAEGDSYYTGKERKTRDYTDYVDHSIELTMSSYTTTSVVLSSTNEVAVGDLLYQAPGLQSLITALVPGTVTVQDSLTWAPVSGTTFVDGDVSVANNTVSDTAHGYATGVCVTLTSTGTLPGGLSTGTSYYIIVSDANTYKFATSLSNAQAGTAVDITSAAGGGTHTVTPKTFVYKGINCEIEYAAVAAGNPGESKAFYDCACLFRVARFNTANVSFATDVSQYFEGVDISGNRTGLWGLFPWGEQAWGGAPTTVPIRTLVPLEKTWGSFIRMRFTHRQGYGYFKLNGFSLPVDTTGEFKIAK